MTKTMKCRICKKKLEIDSMGKCSKCGSIPPMKNRPNVMSMMIKQLADKMRAG